MKNLQNACLSKALDSYAIIFNGVSFEDSMRPFFFEREDGGFAVFFPKKEQLVDFKKQLEEIVEEINEIIS